MLSSCLQAETWTYNYLGREGDSILKAEFSLSLNAAVKKPRAILFILEDHSKDNRAEHLSPQLTQLAIQTQSVIIGCTLTTRTEQGTHLVERGGRFAIVECLREFSKKSERLADLDRLKILFIGRSSGAQFAYEFSLLEYDRVAGMILLNLPELTKIPTSEVRQVPVLFINRENASKSNDLGLSTIFEQQRRYGALWCQWEMPPQAPDYLIPPFISLFVEQTLQARLHKTLPTGALKSLGSRDGWTFKTKLNSYPDIVEFKNVPRQEESKLNWYATQVMAERMWRLIAQSR